MTRCFSASGTPPMYSAHRPRDGTAARRMNSHMIDYTYTATRTSGDATSQRQPWRPLELLNIYRLISSALLTFVALVHVQLIPLGEQNPALFIVVSIGYLLAALLFVITLHARAPGFHVQLYAQALVDIVCIILLTYSSGGIRSGLGTLLIVTLAGLLGATFFLTALLAYGLARRARESEALAAQRGVDLANMQQLTEYVIQRMQTGVIVIDQNQRIRLINESAWHLLGFPVNPTREMLATLSPELAQHLTAWQRHPDAEPQIVRPTAARPELLPRFAKLGQTERSGTLIFLEDTVALAQQAQQMKLASLGRLTASIAHEIRNPLGAISHAGQLLAESPQLAEGDVHLTEIIREHSRRMNAIVENVLQLSRRQRARPQELALKPWLEQFISDFCLTQNIGAEHITLEVNPSDTVVRMDPQQLHQILWNLCHNGVRYRLAQSGTPRRRLRGCPHPVSRCDRFRPGRRARGGGSLVRALLHHRDLRHRPRLVHLARAVRI